MLRLTVSGAAQTTKLSVSQGDPSPDRVKPGIYDTAQVAGKFCAAAE